MWWGRVLGTYFIFDVKKEEFLIKEMINDGVLPHMQWQHHRRSTAIQSSDSDLISIFQDAGADATIMIASFEGDTVYTYNEARINKRFTAASTFKILNSLIALETGVMAGADTEIEWDGVVRGIDTWNQNQTLHSAYRVSCVWCYQKIAEQVGADVYRSYISKDGELAEPFSTTRFWLDGSLQVSATEQIEFLKRLHKGDLPFSDDTLATVKNIMVEETKDTYTLRSKTGWAPNVPSQIGWYVGYIERDDQVWVFATNMRIKDESNLPDRKRLTLEALRLKGLLD